MSKRNPYSEFEREHTLLIPNKIRKKLAVAEKAVKRLKHLKAALKHYENEAETYLAQMANEAEYLCSRGWKRKPYEAELYQGDWDSWITPRPFVKNEAMSQETYTVPPGSAYPRHTAMRMQCSEDGHVWNPPEEEWPPKDGFVRCARCGTTGYFEK